MGRGLAKTILIVAGVECLALIATGAYVRAKGFNGQAAAPRAARAATAGKQAQAATGAAATRPEASGLMGGELGKPLSTRVVAYQIEAKLDPSKHSISATETLTYHNLTGQPQQTFPFHLYLNAFQPQSTWMTEVRLNGTRGQQPGEPWDPKHFGSITVKDLSVDGAGDLTSKMEFIHPDDNNALDRTVFQVTLPKPIAPGESVVFHMEFEDVMPEVVERTGYKRDFYMVGQWFPKVGVWWNGAWNCHQFHATTEFFSDFGTYDVKLTVPQDEVVGAGGDLVASAVNADGTKTLEFKSEDTHDFSWTASPHFTDVEDSWTGSAGTVKIHLLMSPGNMKSAPRYLKALKGTLEKFDEWVGPYPYDRITVVDPPHGGLDAGGMEYPTLITAGTSWDMPKGMLIPELVVVHEFGHQYWYGMVATNEFEDAWMDEGINSYFEVKIMDALYGKNSFFNFPFLQLSEDQEQRTSYLGEIDADPVTRLGWKFINDQSYGGVSYGKTATVLLTLEKMLGEETMRKVMHEYFLRYRFTHPTGEDFFKTVEDVSGQNLRWFIDQAFNGTNVMDFRIDDAHSDRVNWWEEEKRGSPNPDQLYRTYVTVRRKGDFVAPVDVVVRFEDGTSRIEHWDGKDRWIRYSYVGKSKVESAAVDPQHTYWLDRDFFNNSYTVKGDARATHKLENIWIFMAEWASQLVGWLT